MSSSCCGTGPAIVESSSAIGESSPAIETVRQLNDGFKAFQVLHAGFRNGLFDWLENNGPADKATIATALNLRGAHLGGYLQALEDSGLLVQEEAAYSLAPGMNEVLCSSSPECQADVVEELLRPSGGWASLDRFLSSGWEPQSTRAPATRRHPFAGEADRLVTHLAARYQDRHIHSILCFDGGDGVFAAAACHHFPEATVTVVADADQLPSLQEMLSAENVSHRCEIIVGTALDLPPGEPVDLAVLFHALYPIRRSTDEALARIIARLAPDGELFSAHWFCLEACATAPGGLRDLDKAVLTDSHPMCQVETFCQRLENLGLIDADREELNGEYGATTLHFARNPRETVEA